MQLKWTIHNFAIDGMSVDDVERRGIAEGHEISFFDYTLFNEIANLTQVNISSAATLRCSSLSQSRFMAFDVHAVWYQGVTYLCRFCLPLLGSPVPNMSG
jgi:hypothetical protein